MELYQKLLKETEQRGSAVLITELGEKVKKRIFQNGEETEQVEEAVEEAKLEGEPRLVEDGERKYFIESFCREERLIILGGGHVGLALAEFAARTGFQVCVVDDRPSFANQIRFPWATEVLCEGFASAIEKLQINEHDYITILTRGHRHDGDCLRALYKQKKSAYLGMIGSRRRVKQLKEQLHEEDEIAQEWLDFIHSPIGLNIGAVSPEEIAIAILAEIIQVKRTEQRMDKVMPSDVDMRVMERLANPDEKRKNQGKAIVTIVETKGSTPRKAGAKMIVYEDGAIEGTIGGGCAEAGISQTARKIIQKGGYLIQHIDMTGAVAEDEGMVCGGVMKVLIEKA